MLEKKIAALTAAVEALTKVIQSGAIKNDAPAPAKAVKAPKPAKVEEAPAAKVEEAPAPEETQAPAKKVTLQDIREVAQQCLDADKLSGVIGINKKYGLRKIGEATEDKFADLHADLKALLNG